MEERINQALVQIENDLREIQSAKKQVDSVMSASSQLQNKVGTFVTDVANLSQQVKDLMRVAADERNSNQADFKSSLEELEKSCNDIVLSFERKSSVAANAVKLGIDNLHEEIEKLDSIQNNLVSATTVVRTLNDNIENLMAELKNSQSAQDEELKNIAETQSGIDDKSVTIQKAIQEQDFTLKQLSQSLNAANAALSEVNPFIEKKISKLQVIVIIQLILTVIGFAIMFIVR